MTGTSTRLTAALADRYRIERELGAGGMATVYLAHDLKHDRQVAIKVLHPHLAAVLGAERFLKEIRTTAQLQHLHILPLYDSGDADGLLFYVMPFVGGESLRERLTREQRLPVADAVRLTAEVASALDYAHRQGVIHRDIKPENILLHDRSALVADFGIALAPSGGEGRLTETGMSLGTPAYMSPEQALGERELDARSDIYAVGAMLYEMLIGAPPFTGPSARAIVAKVLTEQPVPPSRLRKDVPAQVEAAVLTALAKDPANRFATAGALHSAVVGTSAPMRRRGPSTRVSWWVASVAVAILLGAFALRMWKGRAPAVAVRRAPYAAAVRLEEAAAAWATKRTRQGCDSAIALYSQATDIDTLYAEAWGGLAKTHALCALFGTDNPKEEFSAARMAATKALTLDTTLSSARTASGMVNVFHQQDFPAAQRDFALAIKSDPTQYQAWLFRAWAYLGEGILDSVVPAVRTAQALRPVGDETVDARLATVLRSLGDYAGAQRELTKLLERDPSSGVGVTEQFELDVALGRCDGARRNLASSGSAPQQYAQAMVAIYRAKCDRPERARRFADSLSELSSTGAYVDYFSVAMVYAALGDTASTLRSLNKAVDDHNWALFFLSTHWAFAAYRDLPEYAGIMKRAHVK